MKGFKVVAVSLVGILVLAVGAWLGGCASSTPKVVQITTTPLPPVIIDRVITATPNPVKPTDVLKIVPTATPFIWDGTFGGAAPFYADGDELVEGFRDKNATVMSYSCTNDFAVVITSDPGIVDGVSSGDHGFVALVDCDKGKVLTFFTPYWSDNAEHWSIHLVEINTELPADITYRKLLIALQNAEKKPIALFFSSDGTCETIPLNK